MAKEKMTFEQAITQLDEIVKKLEKGDAPLDEALTLFEDGTKLIKKCSVMLDSAEQKVCRLQKGEDGAPIELEFDTVE